jgi:phosphoribosyl 1,2-cyclic phosphodiesterase
MDAHGMQGDARAAASTADPEPGTDGSAVGLRATCWGTRGSIPSPGPATARFGGNTPCLEIRTADDRCYIFDAGTGLRVLGNRLAQQPGSVDVDLFVTHFHWDHIQGIPFFRPLYDPEACIRIHAARQGELDIETLLKTQMGPVYFPVPYDALAATLTFVHLEAAPWTAPGLEVATFRVRHPADTLGFRVRVGGASLAYIPDNELAGSRYPVDHPGWYDELVEFVSGVDLLFHDAMFTEQEYLAVEGWGHSTFGQAMKLAEDARVRRLLFFHHAPERSDAELLTILEEGQEELAARGSGLELGVAAEGEELLVPALRS